MCCKYSKYHILILIYTFTLLLTPIADYREIYLSPEIGTGARELIVSPPTIQCVLCAWPLRSSSSVAYWIGPSPTVILSNLNR